MTRLHAALLFLAIQAPAFPADPLRFEVASIRKSKSDGMKGGMETLPGGGLRMDGVTVKGLIALAYDVREEQISGGPKWLEQDTYSLLAKAERAEAAATGPGSPSWNRLRERLQTLLADRCRLSIRRDPKPTSGYALVQAKGGTKLTPTKTPMPAGTMRSRGAITGRSGTMQMLATVLSAYVGQPVEDRTGLADSYDYKLEYAQDGPEATVSEGASIFTALQEQLGLKLEPARVAVEKIVIEKVEKPSDN